MPLTLNMPLALSTACISLTWRCFCEASVVSAMEEMGLDIDLEFSDLHTSPAAPSPRRRCPALDPEPGVSDGTLTSLLQGGGGGGVSTAFAKIRLILAWQLRGELGVCIDGWRMAVEREQQVDLI